MRLLWRTHFCVPHRHSCRCPDPRGKVTDESGALVPAATQRPGRREDGAIRCCRRVRLSRASFTVDAQRNMVDNGSIYNTVTVDPATLALALLAGAFTTPGTRFPDVFGSGGFASSSPIARVVTLLFAAGQTGSASSW